MSMRMHTFKNRSTFTYLGRNARLYRRVLNARAWWLEQDSRRLFKNGNEKKDGASCLIAGPGPFEAFYAASLARRHRVVAVDNDQRMTGMIEEIMTGRPVPFSRAAECCVDIDDDGRPIENKDLLQRDRLRKADDEMFACGYFSGHFVSDDLESFQLDKGYPGIHPVKDDILGFVQGREQEFDAIFMCNLFTELRKELPAGVIAKLFFDLGSALKIPNAMDKGILALGTTPAGLHGERNIVWYLQNAGLEVSEILVDNLVNAGGSLKGGYGIVSRRDGPFMRLSPMQPEESRKKAIEASVLGPLELFKDIIPMEELGSFLEETARLVLSATRMFTPMGKGQYAKILSVDRDQALEKLPSERASFDLLR